MPLWADAGRRERLKRVYWWRGASSHGWGGIRGVLVQVQILLHNLHDIVCVCISEGGSQ